MGKDLTTSEVRVQLERLVRGSCLRAAPRQQRLLRHVVEATLAGEAERLKGYTVGIEVFDRRADFDPNLDPIVRVEMGRLRSKLLGHYSGEGIGDPVQIDIPKGGNAARFQRRAVGGPALRVQATGAPSPTQPRVAVLIFSSPPEDPRLEFIAEGIAEDLLTELSKLSGLFVISRHASFAYRGADQPLAAIAGALGVRYIVEGSLRAAHETLRVSARLVDAEQSSVLWGERYDRVNPELFDVQDDVIRQIVRALAVRLTPLEDARLAVAPTTSGEARSLVQRGIGLFWTYTQGNLAIAEQSFTEAVQIDPQYAAAHAWLAAAAIVRHILIHDRTDRSAALAQRHAQLALDIDPMLAWAQAIACHVQDWLLRDPKLAIATGRRAIDLDPNMADGHTILALALAAGQQNEEALKETEISMRLNPRPTGYTYNARGLALRLGGRLEEAIVAYRLGLEAHPGFLWNAVGMALCLQQMGNEQEAMYWITDFRAKNGGDLHFRNRLADPTIRSQYSRAMHRLGFIELS